MAAILSEIFAALALVMISLTVLLTIRHFLPLRQTPAYYVVPIFYALFLPAGMVLLVPIDLASSSISEDIAARGIWLPQRLLLVWWRITYWLTFCLTWFILPVLGEYSDSGYRDPYDRLQYSLRQNAQFHAIVIGSSIIGLLYLIFTYGFTMSSIKTTVMALSYCWGLLFAIYLMGHGLVSIPRTLFRNASLSSRLRQLQTHAPKLHEKLEDAELELDSIESVVAELSRRKGTTARAFADWIEELADSASLIESGPLSPRAADSVMRTVVIGDVPPVPIVVTKSYMADISRRLMRAKHARSRYSREWAELVSEAAHTQTLLDSEASRKLDFGEPSPDAPFWERITVLTPWGRYMLYVHILPIIRIILGSLLSVASVCIIWSELVKEAAPAASIVRLSIVHHWTRGSSGSHPGPDGDTSANEARKGQVGFGGQLVAAFWLLYMCIAMFASISEVKVWRGRGLTRRNTSHESAFWYAGQVAKLSVPLAYNFLTFVSPEFEDTVFHNFLGRYVDYSALGRGFNIIFPAFVLIPVCAAFFGLYSRVQRALGLDWDMLSSSDDEDGNLPGYGTGSWREGRDLIEQDLGGNSLAARHAEAISRLNARTAGTTSPGSRTPIRTVPRTQGSGRALGRSLGTTTAAERERRIAAEAEEAESGNFFSMLGHRMKNTIDTFERPRWLTDLGENGQSAGNNEGGFMRLFGGSGALGTSESNDGGRLRI